MTWRPRSRTAVYREGEVDCLVATKWYDDGPYDLCGQLPCLREQSALRLQIPDVSLGDLIPLLERELAPLTINDLTLPLILALPEFESRPELIIPLQHAIDSATFLAYDTVVQAATLAMQAREHEFALQLLRNRLLHRRHWYWYYSVDQPRDSHAHPTQSVPRSAHAPADPRSRSAIRPAGNRCRPPQHVGQLPHGVGETRDRGQAAGEVGGRRHGLCGVVEMVAWGAICGRTPNTQHRTSNIEGRKRCGWGDVLEMVASARFAAEHRRANTEGNPACLKSRV